VTETPTPSKPTPGPWTLDPEEENVYAREGRVWLATSWNGNLSNETRAANARLIACAPELLEALKAWCELAEHHGVSYQEMAKYRALIARAEGRKE
jgi:hypothetical protein